MRLGTGAFQRPPQPTLVRLPTAAHSVLDTRGEAARRIIAEVVGGRPEALAAQSDALDRLPSIMPVRIGETALALAPRIAAVLPRFGVPRLTT